MTKQDSKGSTKPDQDGKASREESQELNKGKAPLERRAPAGQGAMQGIKSQDNRKGGSPQKGRQSNDFDRNEGQERSQKS